MKKIQNFFLMGTVALTGMAGMTACSSDSEPAQNPNGENAVVKTQFAINVPYATGTTRMTETNTQGEGKNFLGMSNIRLMTIVNSNNTELSDATDIGSVQNIGDDKNAYDKDNTANSQFRSVYRDITVPVGTTDLVLYGRATSTGQDAKAAFSNGYIQISDAYTNGGKLGDITFSLVRIAPNANFANEAEAITIINSLNNIVRSSVQDGEETVTWKNVGESTPERKVLQERYNVFTTLTSGSAVSVKSAINGLMQQLGEPGDDKPLTKEILKRCKQAIADINGSLFPTKLNLPEGAARLNFTDIDEPTFSYVAADASVTGDNAINYNNITYPASLGYFVSTKAMVSDNELTSVSQLPTYADWTGTDAVQAWSDKKFKQEAVKTTTRAIGLKDAVQYGMASLKLSVKTGGTTLKDNANKYTAKGDNDINVKANTFELVGVLVGGQPQSAGWDFTPNTENFDRVIYDRSINTGNAGHYYVTSADPSLYNYTLVFDNNKAEQDKSVYVTLEMKNNGGEFYGQNGIVPNGGTFYLVGQLNLEEGKDKGDNVDHIFTKDHKTIAKFTISSLKNAYNCIPDLRTSKIAVGLAVDLTWQKGITFEYEIK